MANIPTVPGSYQQQSTPTPAVQADFSTLDAPNRAASAQGAAIGEVGRQVGDVALKLQSAVNYGMAADADRQMRAAAAEFQQSRIGRTDEDQWQTQWKEKSDEVWQGIQETMPIGPLLRRQLTANFKDWQASNAIEVSTMANKQRINRAVDRVGLAADEAARDGDEHGIVAAFDGAVVNHLMLPEQADKLKKEYLTKVDEYSARNYIMNNPAGAVDFLEEQTKGGKYVNLTRLTADQRLTLINTARVQFTKYQTDNYDDLIKGLQQGTVATPAELTGLVANKVISAKQRKTYEDAYRHGNYNTSVDSIGKMFSDLNDYDPQKDPQFRDRAKLLGQIATSGFPQNVQTEMNQLLSQKTDPKHVLNSPVAKDAFEGIDQRFRLGLYGKFETKVEDKEGNIRTVVNPKVYESAMQVKRRVEDAARKFLNENPQASAEDVNNFVSNVQMTNVVRSGRQTLLGALGQGLPTVNETADQKKARLDAILAKAKK